MAFSDEDLIFGDPAELAAFLGVSARTIQRYKRGTLPLPEACRKLLRLRLEGDLRALGGNDWEGFYISRGLMQLPGWRGGFGPHEIRSMFFRVQQVASLERMIRDRDARIGELRVPVLFVLELAFSIVDRLPMRACEEQSE